MKIIQLQILIFPIINILDLTVKPKYAEKKFMNRKAFGQVYLVETQVKEDMLGVRMVNKAVSINAHDLTSLIKYLTPQITQ